MNKNYTVKIKIMFIVRGSELTQTAEKIIIKKIIKKCQFQNSEKIWSFGLLKF